MTDKEKKEAGEKGYYMAQGAARAIANILIVAVITVFVCRVIINSLSWFTDDTDKYGWKRSGMSLHTDYKTGIQYLTTPSGGITVRVQPQPQ